MICPVTCGVTVAVKVTDCPKFDGFSEEAQHSWSRLYFTTCFTGFDVLAWIGLVAVTAVPDDIRARMREEIAKAIGTPAVRKRLIESGLDSAAISGDRFESITRLSPYPDASLTHLLPGTLEIRFIAILSP